MSQNHVDQPHAQLLKEGGWKWRTYFSWIIRPGKKPELSVSDPAIRYKDAEYISAPNLSELLDQIAFTELETYFHKVATYTCGMDCFDEWLYKTMKNPNALAAVWVWKEKP
jgi:hypothetical protein